ncbi:MAG: AsnC family transcriptional regulator [Candidatus Thorarchaeota archaeon]|jgi:DNA-binding Lrp family transcriptional regulator
MDLVDKRILLSLNANCRASYEDLGQMVGLTRAAIKKRVDRLVEIGVLERFVVELSREMAGYEWSWIEIDTDGSETTDALIDAISKHPMVFVLNRLGGCKFLIFGQITGASGAYDLGRYLRSLPCIDDVRIEPLLAVENSSLTSTGFLSSGKTMDLTSRHLKILRCLLNNARMPTSEISRKTGYTPKSIRKNIQELQQKHAISFTIYLSPSSSGNTDFYLQTEIDEEKVRPEDVVLWFESNFNLEYWNSWQLTQKPILRNYFSVKDLNVIEKITDRVRESTFVKSVEPIIKYPNKIFQSIGRTKLIELLDTNDIVLLET